MHAFRPRLLRLAVLLTLLAPQLAYCAGDKADAIVIVADSRPFSGWQAWWTNLYNENLGYFAILTIIVIPTVGVLLGVLTDFCMARIGINLKSRSVGEH